MQPRHKLAGGATAKMIGRRTAICVLQIYRGMSPSKDLGCLINISSRVEWKRNMEEMKMVSAHNSFGIACRLPLKAGVCFISALRCHQPNVKDPLLWALTADGYFWTGLCGAEIKRERVASPFPWCYSLSNADLKLDEGPSTEVWLELC